MTDLIIKFLDLYCDLRGCNDYLVAVIEIFSICFFLFLAFNFMFYSRISLFMKARRHNQRIARKKMLKKLGHLLMEKHISAIVSTIALYVILFDVSGKNIPTMFSLRKEKKYRLYAENKVYEFILQRLM